MVATHVSKLGFLLGEAINHATKERSDPPEMHYHPVVTIQTGERSKAPIFCVPGAGGNAVAFSELAAALGEDWSLRSLQPRGLDAELAPHTTVESAASAYLRAINATQPDGPVHLIGHSFGGWVAFEIALQMRSINRTVASLTLVDTNLPTDHDVAGDQYSASQVVQELIRVLELRGERSLGINPMMLESLDDVGRLELLHKRMVSTRLISQYSRPELLRGVIRTFGAALRTTYQPQKTYPDPVSLVLVPDMGRDSEANRRHYGEVLMGWKQWAPQALSWTGPGNHMTILDKPHVQILADWWRNTVQAEVGY